MKYISIFIMYFIIIFVNGTFGSKFVQLVKFDVPSSLRCAIAMCCYTSIMKVKVSEEESA